MPALRSLAVGFAVAVLEGVVVVRLGPLVAVLEVRLLHLVQLLELIEVRWNKKLKETKYKQPVYHG